MHPSLYGKSDCIVVMLRYLNELSFYYMSTGTVEEAQVRREGGREGGGEVL